LNFTALSKIWKKYDKLHQTDLRWAKLESIQKSHAFLNYSTPLLDLKDEVQHLLRVTTSDRNKPNLPPSWEQRKVYTIGCFDLFHRGHSNILTSLREFGYYIVAGIHDDASYYKLKNKYPIDTLEVRMRNVKPFVDQLYVIPSTDPLPYIQAAVSSQDIEMGTVCYARGDDMLNFPAREWVESVMPVYFVPRTESCSSTLIRTIYHSECEELRGKAAFAKTRYDGKPVCEKSGEVLKLHKKSMSCPAVADLK
jgi:cytidyltransferase-like protein